MITQLALRLLFGISLMWCLMPRRQITSGFFRIQMLVALGLSVLSCLTCRQFPPHVHAGSPVLSPNQCLAGCIAIAVTAFMGSVLWTLERRTSGSVAGAVIAGISGSLLLLSTSVASAWSTQIGVLYLLSEVATAGLLGSALTGMLLGHWYLTAPTMSIAPLNRMTLLLAAFSALRLLLSLIGLRMAWSSLQLTGPHGLWLLLRWTGGILGPIVVAAMVWQILKYRNTQSATGVLFVGVILTFIGELTATLLYRELAIAL